MNERTKLNKYGKQLEKNGRKVDRTHEIKSVFVENNDNRMKNRRKIWKR